MRVGLFTDIYLPCVSGVVTAISSLKDALEEKGHEVFIITVDEEKNFKYRKEGNVIRIPGIKTGVYDYSVRITYPFKAIKMVEDLKLDIIHSHTEFGIGRFGKSMAKKLNIPFIQTFHTMYEDTLSYITKGLFPKLSKKVLTKAIESYYNDSIDQIIVPSEKIKKVLTEKYKIQPEINIVPNGIRVEQFYKENYKETKTNKLRKELNLSKDDFVILWVGRLGYEKNIRFLVENHKKIMNNHPDAKLLIVGGGPEEDNLKAISKKLEIENNVIFTGKIKYEDVGNYYQLGSVFVSASIFETQGLTLVEALAGSIPVVCINDDSFISVMKQGYNGYMFKNKTEYIKYINKLIENPDHLQELKNNSKESSNVYSLSAFADNIVEVYNKELKK